MRRRQRPTEKPSAKSIGEPDFRQVRRQEQDRNVIRIQIAQAAARLIAEGLTDIYDAKQKAARRLNVTDDQALPDNHEIESALRDHFKLFACESQWRELQALRKVAIRALSWLQPFSPWLTGSVLSGTANRFSAIELELIEVEPKDFEIYLLNAKIDYQLCNSRPHKLAKPAGRPPEAVFRLEFDQTPITIKLYDSHLARQRCHPQSSLNRDRVQRAEAESRFTADSAGN